MENKLFVSTNAKKFYLVGINVHCSVMLEHASKPIKIIHAEKHVIKRDNLAITSAVSSATWERSAKNLGAKQRFSSNANAETDRQLLSVEILTKSIKRQSYATNDAKM